MPTDFVVLRITHDDPTHPTGWGWESILTEAADTGPVTVEVLDDDEAREALSP